MITQRTPRASVRGKAAHQMQQWVISQGTRISHVHSALPGHFSLSCRLWENSLVSNSVVKPGRTVKENKKCQLCSLRGFTGLFLTIFSTFFIWEKILLIITQCLSWNCFCISGYQLKSIHEPQILTSLWDFT